MTDPPPRNPYAPPETSPGQPEREVVDERAMALRRKNLGHESIFRALGLVNAIGVNLDLLYIAVASYYVFKADGIWAGSDPESRTLFATDLFVTTPALVIFHLALGWGLPRFRRWAFRGQVLLSSAASVYFLAFVGFCWAKQAFGAYSDFTIASITVTGIAHFAILYCLLGTQCRRVIAQDYREAVAATSGLRARGSWPIAMVILPFSIAVEWGLLAVANEVAKVVNMLRI